MITGDAVLTAVHVAKEVAVFKHVHGLQGVFLLSTERGFLGVHGWEADAHSGEGRGRTAMVIRAHRESTLALQPS